MKSHPEVTQVSALYFIAGMLVGVYTAIWALTRLK